ncbi:hypothetical protein ACP70R_032065 [Stipagrostis hirtigluma subsp. patula]
MPRGKLAMELIQNPKKRKATSKNRRDGLLQKISQLETLCGVDGFLVCYGPLGGAAAGQQAHDGGAEAVTTWPPDRQAVLDRIARFRATPADKLQHVVDVPTFLHDELAKQQRKRLRVAQCGAGERLDCWHRSLDDLSAADLNALHDKLEDTLQRVHRRIVALGGSVVVAHDDVGDVVAPPSSDAAAAVAVAAPAPLAMQPLPDNAFDFAFGLPDAGTIVTQYYYPPYYDMLPPLQPPCIGFQMPPPCLGFQMPPPATTLLAPDFGMTGTGTMDVLPYATDGANVASTVAGFYNGDLVPGFAAGGGRVDDDVLGQSFAAGNGSGGYDDPANYMTAGVWPLTWLNNPMDGASFQQRNGSEGLPGSSSSSSSFQGSLQK